MRCLYCDKQISAYTFRSLLLKEDLLCPECRKQLKVKHKIIDMGDFEVESFFEYDGLYKSLLLQYKECGDEALRDVFLYDIKEYLELKYRGYVLQCIPSSRQKREERGFDHLPGMFRLVQMKQIDALKMKEDLTQEGRNFSERQAMISNFDYIGGNYKAILIADDVITTGSTLKGAFYSTFEHCEKVKVVALAYKNNALHY